MWGTSVARARRLAVIAVLSFTAVACANTPATAPAPAPVPPVAAPAPTAPTAGAPAPTEPPARICDNVRPGPPAPPPGAVSVDPAVDSDLATKTSSSPPGTTFWLAPGRHTLGTDQYGQVTPKDGNTYIGAPGAILDGRGLNMYAFVATAKNVTISNLTVRGFIPPVDQGVVNHDSGEGWIVTDNLMEDNRGAAMMAGVGQRVLRNCLRNNGQYGINAFGGHLLVEGNEISGNNTDDLEHTLPGGCGCTGAIKFWDVNGADVRNNWIHDNRGTALWADTNDNDFLIENNLIENNDGEGFFLEISYNTVFRNNTLRRNAWVKGREFAERNDDFPVAAIYLSEAGGEPRVPARTDKVDIYGNVLEDNWSGITLWENADRFCNSPANTSSGYCTRLLDNPEKCSSPAIDKGPLYNDCRWKTQRVHIHDNVFRFDPNVVGCSKGFAGRMSVLSNWGTVPDWSPYKERVIQDSITFKQDNVWRANTYVGPWSFGAFEAGRELPVPQWQAAPYGQDSGSTFDNGTVPRSC